MFPSAPSVYGKGKKQSGDKTAAPGHHPAPVAGRLAVEFKGSSSAIRPCPLKCLTHDFQLWDDVNQMWSLQTAAQDGAQRGWGLDVAPRQLCPSGRTGRDGDTLGSGLADGVFTVCLLLGDISGRLSSWGEQSRGDGLVSLAGQDPRST